MEFEAPGLQGGRKKTGGGVWPSDRALGKNQVVLRQPRVPCKHAQKCKKQKNGGEGGMGHFKDVPETTNKKVMNSSVYCSSTKNDNSESKFQLFCK